VHQLRVFEQASYRRAIVIIAIFHILILSLYGIIKRSSEVYVLEQYPVVSRCRSTGPR